MINKKSFTLGMSIGIILLSIIFFISYSSQKKILTNMIDSKNEPIELTEDEIIVKARELGMEYKYKMSNEITEKEVIEKAFELGMIFEKKNEVKTEVIPEVIKPEANNEKIESVEPETVVSENIDTKVKIIKVNEDGATSIEVPDGILATEFSGDMVKLGFVENLEEFRKLIITENKSRKILSGKFSIPKDASSLEILKIVTRDYS